MPPEMLEPAGGAPAPAAPAAVAAAAPSPAPAPAPAAPAAAAAPEAAAPALSQPAAAPAEPAAPAFTPSLLEQGVPSEPTDPAQGQPPAEPAKAEGEPKAPGEQAAPTEQPGPAEAAPVYEFTFPEGFDRESVDAERLNAFTALLGENKVASPAAQQLLDMHAAEVGRIASELSKQQWDVFQRQQEAAISEVRSDPEIGGSRFVTAMRDAARVIEQYGGTPDEQRALKQVFTNTGAGNNVLVLRLLSRIGGNALREGAPVPANPIRPRPPTGTERGLTRYAGSNTPGAVSRT